MDSMEQTLPTALNVLATGEAQASNEGKIRRQFP